MDENGRLLLSILTDPQISQDTLDNRRRKHKSYMRRPARRLYARKGIRPMPTAPRSRLILSHCIGVDGASNLLNNTTDHRICQAMARARKAAAEITRVVLVEPYEYVRKRLKKPPDGTFWGEVMNISIMLSIIAYIYWIYLKGKYKQRGRDRQHDQLRDVTSSDPDSQSYISKLRNLFLSATPVKVVKIFASESDGNKTASFAPFSFQSDGIPFAVDNCANAHICSEKRLFIDELKPSGTRVLTANGPGEELLCGTIRASWDDDGGVIHTYDLPGVLYSPSSSANIISITMLGEMFGKQDQPPTRDETGTFVNSNASYTQFTWDHGKHTRQIIHGSSRLPEIQINSGNHSFASYVNKLRRVYNDAVSYAFTTEIDDGLSEEAMQSAREFQVGDSVNYVSGDGTVDAAKYLGVIEMEIGDWHEIVLASGEKITTDVSHLTLLDQPDLTNIPFDVDSYCKEVGEGLTEDDIKLLARPKSLSPLQQEFMHLHEKMYHMPFHMMIRLAKSGHLPKRLLKLRNDTPICVSCQFGKAHKRPWRSKGKRSNPIRKVEDTKVGDCVSTDQIVSAQPGLIPQMNGYLTSDRIWGVTVFVDHASDFTYGHLMRSLDLEDTLQAKQAFEKLCSQSGHTVHRYHADNGRYADQGFMASINANDQTITFCGVRAHHQNGIVERRIRLITETARTLLLHAQRHWPGYITTMLWPFAVKAAIERLNYLNFDLDGKTPASKFFGTDQASYNLNQFHTFGCPVFVLDSRLQTGTIGPPKWEPRCRVGIYLGHSPFHAGSVSLVLNPQTGHVSPQYHVTFDDSFVTVPYMRDGTTPPTWEEMCKNSTELATDEAFDLAETWFKEVTQQTSNQPIQDPFQVVSPGPSGMRNASASEGATQNQATQSNNAEGARNVARRSSSSGTTNSNSPVDRRVTFDASLVPGAGNNRSAATGDSSPGNNDDGKMPPMINLAESGLRRSERLKALREMRAAEERHPRAQIASSMHKKSFFSRAVIFGLFTIISSVCLQSAQSRIVPLPPNASQYERLVNRFHEANELFDGTLNVLHNSVLTTDVSTNEVYTYAQIMKLDDVNDFLKAMEDEVLAHETRGHWTMVLRSSLPSGVKTIRAIWSFKRKRFPDGRINKHKARLCAHGGMQQWGENYWETYSPVVNMLSVRLLLAISHLHDLETQSIDFVLAFPQADLDVDVWMELPEGMNPEGVDPKDRWKYVLKLNKSLYGLKQASHNWYLKLKEALVVREFKPSEIDPCIFLKPGMIVLVYVDDCIIVSDNKMKIQHFVHSLRTGPENFVLTEEGTLDKFLGINIQEAGPGKYELSQPFLIERLVNFVENGIQLDLNSKETPTPVGKPLLHKDENGKPRKHSWNYRTAVGMSGYLQGSTRPEISMASHQCARFVTDPKRSHERAMIRLVRYLKSTKDRGIIYEPKPELGLECFVDADFAGGWTQADADNPEQVMSRTGYVIRYAGCPVGWCSKLQSEIALSTAEAEYIALSQALREVIPLVTLLDKLGKVFTLYTAAPDFVCKVWEDNQSCIAMAESTKFSPRTKHIALKYHHFKQFQDSGRIKVSYVNTHDQLADLLMKPLNDQAFFKLRKMLMGW